MVFGKGNPMEIREAHYKKHFGNKLDKVMHVTDGLEPHVDVYPYEPFEDRDYWTLITGGMSDIAQPLPDDLPGCPSHRTELLMYTSELKPWMSHALVYLARFPFVESTFLHHWHTADYSRPVTDDKSLLTAFFFLPPYFEDPSFHALHLPAGKVTVLWALPITRAELDYKLEHGGEALEELFTKHQLDPVVDEKRKSLV